MFTNDATAFLAEIADDNTREFFRAHRDRFEREVHAPMRALAAALEPEFGPLRVLRPYRNRRFAPDAPPYRVDAGAVAGPLGVVLSATALTVAAGQWAFDGGQLRRYRQAVDGRLSALLDDLGLPLDRSRALVGTPRGFRADDPHIGLLRLRGLRVTRSWPVDEWLASPEPLARVRDFWRTARPLLHWLDVHVGPADPVKPRPRPAVVAEPE